MKNIVFLIEDELDIMYIYKTALKAAGINIEPISTGKEAVEKLKKVQEKLEEKPVLVLLDLVLPDINGLEILHMIRENSVTKNIPVFVISNYDSDALHNMKYIKPDKMFLKTSITPTQLADIVKAQIGSTPIESKPIVGITPQKSKLVKSNIKKII